ncbi:XkdX family protein [Lactobacillus sp. ESL0230]|uniref:XkdX family protein n=1 Tax=Lactobacillus sp. ESL0230 TaxID=2069353 RepID=UPI000EFCC712|nr:XkdX family protein [Lactobacillus sp. ESL0230]RMC46505.1 XkdX family protein [Lactobacillus sp. ESL0230]
MHDLFRELAQAEFNSQTYTSTDIQMLVGTGVLNSSDYKEITGEDYVAKIE